MLLQGNERIKRIALCGVFSALAICVSLLESLLPIQAFIPLPGIKLGLSNIISVYVLYYIGSKDAFCVTLCRCAVCAVLFGTVTSFLFSVCGGVFSLISSVLLKRIIKDKISFLGVCVVGAACHNVGQIAVCCAMFGTLAVCAYLPPLLFASVVCGSVTGVILWFLPDLVKIK